MTAAPDLPGASKLGDIAAAAGVRRIHVLAWRDLDDPEAGGSERFHHEVARRWAEAGLHVTMRTSYAAGRAPEIVRDGYRVIRRAGRYMVFPRAVLSEWSGRHGPSDALLEVWNGIPFFSPVWYRGPRLVLVHHVHGSMFRTVLPAARGRFGEFVESGLAPLFYRRTTVGTVSASSRDELVARLRLNPARIPVVPQGLDDCFCPDPSVPRSPEPLVVAVGRLVPTKRQALLITQAALARERVPGLRLRILGEGYERERLERLIGDLGAQDWVELAGWVDEAELLQSYREAWIVASASSHEGWGMTITEAGACGTPAVATDISGHRDSVSHGVSGLLSAPDRLGQTLAQILEDHELRGRLGRGARARAAGMSWDATARRVLELIADEARGSVPRVDGPDRHEP